MTCGRKFSSVKIKLQNILGKIGKPTSNPDVRMKSAINAPPQLLDVRSHAIHGPLNYLRLSSCVILGEGGLPRIMVPAHLSIHQEFIHRRAYSYIFHNCVVQQEHNGSSVFLQKSVIGLGTTLNLNLVLPSCTK